MITRLPFSLGKEPNTMKRIVLAFLILISSVSFAFADTIFLRDGRQIRGTLLGFVNGRFVVRVENQYSSSTAGSNVDRNRRDNDLQYFRPEEVERIEIEGRSLDDARSETRNVQVTLDSNWIDSGVYVRRGQRVQVSATGVITVGRSRITPDGLRSTDPSAPLPSANEGKLIGAIGNDPRSPIIELGSNNEFTAERNGRLFLTANRGSFADARGGFDVSIRSERNLNARDDEGGGIRSRNRDNTGGGSRGNQRERTFDVPGNSRGLDTGIDLRAGEAITISATGTIVAGTRVGEVGPDGQRSSGLGISARPVASAGVGALIAYIRNVNGQRADGWPFDPGGQR
jgi:hypothetical protein